MRPAWHHGRNYDVASLAFSVADRGFTLGESELGGEDLLGEDGTPIALPKTFTQIAVDSKCTVDDGLFVHRETAICSLAATLPAMLDLKGKRLRVSYSGTTLFEGLVREVRWAETVDQGRDYLPGNTAIKTYRVSLRATAGEERFATAPTPARNFTESTPLVDRIASWTGLPVLGSPGTGYGNAATNIGQDAGSSPVTNYGSWWSYVTLADQLGTLQDTLRRALRLYNLNYRLTPDGIQLTSNQTYRVWEGGPLEFTDEAFTDTSGDDWLHGGDQIGYTERAYGDDPSLWASAAEVTFSNGGTDYVSGPFRAAGEGGEVADVDLGPSQWANFEFVPAATSRIITSSLPLKAKVRPTTLSIIAPMQGFIQLPGQMPYLARVTADGTTEEVAVLGETHTITPDRWLVQYDTGPHHLLDRQSDLDPGPPTGGSIDPSVIDPTNYVTVSWTQPHLPDFAPFLRIWYVNTADYPGTDVGMVSWISNGAGQVYKGAASYPWTEGAAYSQEVPKAQFPLGVAVKVFAAYSSNPDPWQGNPSPELREGRVGYLGTYTRS